MTKTCCKEFYKDHNGSLAGNNNFSILEGSENFNCLIMTYCLLQYFFFSFCLEQLWTMLIQLFLYLGLDIRPVFPLCFLWAYFLSSVHFGVSWNHWCALSFLLRLSCSTMSSHVIHSYLVLLCRKCAKIQLVILSELMRVFFLPQ